jgi:hypothetical protein
MNIHEVMEEYSLPPPLFLALSIIHHKLILLLYALYNLRSPL